VATSATAANIYRSQARERDAARHVAT